MDGVALDKPLDSAVLSRLTQFSAMNKLKKIAIKVRQIYMYFIIYEVREMGNIMRFILIEKWPMLAYGIE